MMRGFRRAQLRGSEELFRSTDEMTVSAPTQTVAVIEPEIQPVPAAPKHDERPVRLTEAEIQVLVEAVQGLKFPHKTTPRPSVEDFERLEALRQKLSQAL